MPKPLPFSEIADGLPVWHVEVDDPQAAGVHPLELHIRRLSLPDGELLALALRIFDVARKPQLLHLAGPLDRPEVAAWAQALRQSGRVRLVLQRSGWTSTVERDAAPPPAELASLAAPIAPGRDPELGIRRYLERYRAELPKLHQPEAVWDAMLRPAESVPTPRRNPWPWIVAALLAAAALAWSLL